MTALLDTFLPFVLAMTLGGSTATGPCCKTCPPDCCVAQCSPENCPPDCCTPGCCGSGSCCTR